MKFIYSLFIGAALGAASVFIHASVPPFGLMLSIVATGTGIWSIGRMWGRRSLKVVASLIWTAVVLRAGFPGASDEYLIEASAVGTSLINVGFLTLIIATLLPI
ncbi:MAG: hypothetical protein F2954_00370 [Actinobacteria bacterium]|uniref:Unannotated protein n=1 Tax=freshwater metagenome TaxID=449393 RepID=A0A6J7VMQ5_9ZZZZ|nr:hypothetical protein [Actinomycetota bacterium]